MPSRRSFEQPTIIKRISYSTSSSRAVVSHASIQESFSRGDDTAGSPQLDRSLSKEQVRRHVSKSVALIKRASVLVPNDEERPNYNVLLTIWSAAF